MSHGLSPKDSRKLRFNPGFNTSINLEPPFSVKSRYKLKPPLSSEVYDIVSAVGPFTAHGQVNTPIPHWMLHIAGGRAELTSLALGFLSSCCHLSPIPCRTSHKAQPLGGSCKRNSPKFRHQPPLQRTEEGGDSQSHSPSPSVPLLTPPINACLWHITSVQWTTDALPKRNCVPTSASSYVL